MNPQVPNELISAYFDGEASPDERAAVERLLAENEDARRELNEIAKVSALLHSFPREFAPQELAANVERQTSQMALPKPARVAAPPVRNRFQEWRAAVVGSLVTAASLTLVAFTWNQFDHGAGQRDARLSVPEKSVSGQMPMTGPQWGVRTPQKVELAESDTVGLKQRSEAKDGAPVAELDTALSQSLHDESLVKQEMLQRKAPGMTAEAAQDEKRSSANLTALPEAEGIGEVGLGLSNEEFKRNLQEGNLFQRVDPDNNVVVLSMAVVDVERAVGGLQRALVRVGIPPKETNEQTKADDAKKAAADNDLVIVFSMGTGPQLANVLQDMEQHPDLVRGWTNEEPLQLEATAAETKLAASVADQPRQAKSSDDKLAPHVDAVAEKAVSEYFKRNSLAVTENADGDKDAGAEGSKKAASKDAAGAPQFRNLAGANRSAARRGSMANSAAPAIPPSAPAIAPGLGNESASGYQVTLRNPAEILPNPVANNSVAQQYNYANSPFQRSRFAQSQNAMPRSEASNRLKMLWVLHPASGEATPPAAKPDP